MPINSHFNTELFINKLLQIDISVAGYSKVFPMSIQLFSSDKYERWLQVANILGSKLMPQDFHDISNILYWT